MTDDKVTVVLEDQVKALEAAVAVLDGDTDRFEAAVTSAGDRHGGLTAFIYALAFEVGNGFVGAHGRDGAADEIECRLDLYRVGIESRDRIKADVAESQARRAAFVAAAEAAAEAVGE